MPRAPAMRTSASSSESWISEHVTELDRARPSCASSELAPRSPHRAAMISELADEQGASMAPGCIEGLSDLDAARVTI